MRDDDDRDFATQVFEMWEYWGEIDAEDLKACNVDLGDEEPLDTYSGCVVLINSTVVKVYLNPLESGDFPYDFYNWERK